MPQKRFYRQRAHVNPLADKDSFDYPPSPDLMNWANYYPAHISGSQIKAIDIGCGYGGLMFALNDHLAVVEAGRPENEKSCILGLEIRTKVTDYVNDKILYLRHQDSEENKAKHGRVSVMRMNAMKYLPNLFEKGQLDMIFILFADPHFKNKKKKWRITSNQLLSEYAYFLRPGGKIYTCTDVKELFEWTCNCFETHPLYITTPQEALKSDPIVHLIENSTEEGSKVSRLGGDNKLGEKYSAVFQRI